MGGCGDQKAGGFEPLERLARLARFFREPEHSLGGRRLALATQRSHAGFADFVENARWTHRCILFSTVHIVGSGNGTTVNGRTPDTHEATRPIDAATAWMRETFAEAIAAQAPAVVIALHANPFFERRASARRRPYEPFVAALEEEAAGSRDPC